MMTAGNWLKRAIVMAMFGMLDSAAFYGEAYDHFKQNLFRRETFSKISRDGLMKKYAPYLGVLFLVGYTVFVLCLFLLQR